MHNQDLPDITYGTIDQEYAAHLGSFAPEDDQPFWMVNLMRYRDKAVYVDGRESDLTGRQADDAYSPFRQFRTVGAELVFLADVEEQLAGDDQVWERIAVVRYPTRQSFLDMQNLPDYVELHAHKDAGMASTFVIGCQPMTWPELPAEAPSLDSVPHPSTPDDGPVVIMHVLKFNEGGGSEDMDIYQNAAARIALPHGVRIDAWLEVEGTIVGDGRSWDQIRFNVFPSQAAFMAVAMDPDRLAAQADNREPAIADTYTMMMRPLINRLGASIND
ncbi:MAG: hypothetical protein WCI26_05285 [Acidimicrobiales bacterium]|jgi:hypothetical protein